MARHYLALAIVFASLAASPALGDSAAGPIDPGTQARLDLPEYGFTLSPARTAPPAPSASGLDPRMPAAIGPGSDFWANLPNPAMTYRTGKTGPKVELGAFGGDMPRLRPERNEAEAGALAHLTFAWDF